MFYNSKLFQFTFIFFIFFSNILAYSKIEKIKKNAHVFHVVDNFCKSRCKRDILKTNKNCVNYNGMSDMCSECCTMSEDERICNINNLISFKHVIMCARNIKTLIYFEKATESEGENNGDDEADPIEVFHSHQFLKHNEEHRKQFLGMEIHKKSSNQKEIPSNQIAKGYINDKIIDNT